MLSYYKYKFSLSWSNKNEKDTNDTKQATGLWNKIKEEYKQITVQEVVEGKKYVNNKVSRCINNNVHDKYLYQQL